MRNLVSSVPRTVGVALAGLLALVSGCGDGPICGDLVVVISSPADGSNVTQDANAAEDGLQTDVEVTSNLPEGSSFTLTVTDGQSNVETYAGTATASGNVTFSNVTLPYGGVTLEVTGDGGDCGTEADTAQVTVSGSGDGCMVSIQETPVESDYYDPLPVLNTSNDSDDEAADFQANFDVVATAGAQVELFVLDVDEANEVSAGTMTADGNGETSFPVTLGQGRQAVRAVCGSDASMTHTYYVDTEVSCTLTAPAEGATVTAADDEDSGTDGVQVTFTGSVGADDYDGESAGFAINSGAFTGTDIASMMSTGTGTFTSSGTKTVSFTTTDYAGNVCTDEHDIEVDLDNCALTVTQPGPNEVITTDSNGVPGDGLQTEIVVEVGSECEGETLTTDCGLGTTDVTVPAGGTTTVEVTLCNDPDAQCQDTEMCSVSVEDPNGNPSSEALTLTWDTQAPNVSGTFDDPSGLSCGQTVTESVDVDGDSANGVQIDVLVVSALAASRWVEVTNNGTTTTFPAASTGEARITLTSGLNTIVYAAEDDNGNVGRTTGCNLTLADIAVNFEDRIADGLVGAGDGTVVGNTLDLGPICGTVSDAGATMVVNVNGTDMPATNSSGNWCTDADVVLAESPPAHDITASANGGAGIAMVSLTVDLSGPDAPAGLAATELSRQSVLLEWTAPDNDGAAADAYIIKYATVEITDANFDTTGTEVSSPPTPGAPGSVESFAVEQLLAGAEYYFAVAAVDVGGNRSTAATAGAVVPDFDATGAITPPNPADGDNGLGFQVVSGLFNDDAFYDVAVSAPFKTNGGEPGGGAVYVYFGSAAGIGSTPDVTIMGANDFVQFGNGLTAMRWNGDTYDDLVIGAPFGDNGNGRAYVFQGGASFGSSPTLGLTDADVVIGVSSDASNWFGGGYMAYWLDSGDFDGDGAEDLFIGVPGGGGFLGGVAILYGGTVSLQGDNLILLSDQSSTDIDGGVVHLIREPNNIALFGWWVHNLGPTEGPNDQTDDIGVAYFDDNSVTDAPVYVFRGRTTRPTAAGVHNLAFSATLDLRIESGSADLLTYFGASMGSIQDLNADGARDIVVGAWHQDPNGRGRVSIVDGDAVGTQTLADITITHIYGDNSNPRFGTGIANNTRAVNGADVDADGQEDLLIAGGHSTSGNGVNLYIWFHDDIPTDTAQAYSILSASHSILAPASFTNAVPSQGGVPMRATWIGDVNNDGLEDLCWSDWEGNDLDGSFEVLWDAPL